MARDLIDAVTMAGMLNKASRIIERAAKNDTFGSQKLWDISHAIKREALRILDEESERITS